MEAPRPWRPTVQQSQAAVEAVRAAAARIRTAKRAWERLARDVLLLLTGIRQAVMVDYAVLSVREMVAILVQVSAALDDPEAPQLSLLEIDGCMYPCNLAALVDACSLRLPPSPDAPLFVMLDGESPRAASEEEATSLAARLLEVLRGLSDGAEAQQAQRQHKGKAHSFPAGVELHPDSDVLLVRLDSYLTWPLSVPEPSQPSTPLLPTINGWLLGYPVVYVVTPQCADTAAALLSRCSLRLFSVHLPCLLISAPQEQHTNPMCASSADVLFSFSIPASLWLATSGSDTGSGQDPDWASLEALSLAVEAAGGTGGGWGSPKLEALTRAPGPVAL